MRRIKKIICFAILLILSLTGCGDKKKEPVLPPTRWGTEGTAIACLEKAYGFESAFEEADMVAHIKVGDWLSEDTENGGTFYEASVIKQYKGEEIKTFVLRQDGNSRVTLEDYPLFTYGNEVFVFCKKGTDYNKSPLYWSIGGFTTMLDVATTKSGETYFLARSGEFGRRTRALADDDSFRSELKEYISEKDPELTLTYGYPYIYSETTVSEWIAETLDKTTNSGRNNG